MKLTIKQNKLLEHLNYVIKGISNKNLIPILNCIKFELNGDGLYLMSTDNEIAIKTLIDKSEIENIDEYGTIVVSGKYIYDIIRKLPNDLINIEELVDSKLNIYTSNSSFNLNCNNASEFPDLELEEKSNPITINKRVFKNIINQTIFATSSQESRPVLTGINFKIEKDTLVVTATDSYRLAKKVVSLNNLVEEEVNIIIPTKNLNELVRMITEDDENLEMHIFNNKVIFKLGNLIMLSRIINGTYPDTSKLIPTDFLLTIKVKLDEFYDSIDRASLLTNESDKNTIKLESRNNTIVVSSNIPEIGNVEEKLEVVKDSLEDIRIAFSSKYMMEALKTLDCEEILLMFNGDIKPIIVKNPESDDLIQLILPIRTY